MTLLAIILAAGFRLLADVFDAYFTTRAIAPVVSEGQLAMKRMIRELGEAEFDTVILNGQSTITFSSGFSNEQVTFYQSPSNGSGIFMDQGSRERQLLAQYVEGGSLSFSIQDYGDPVRARLISISFTIHSALLDGTEVEWPLRSAVHIEP